MLSPRAIRLMRVWRMLVHRPVTCARMWPSLIEVGRVDLDPGPNREIRSSISSLRFVVCMQKELSVRFRMPQDVQTYT